MGSVVSNELLTPGTPTAPRLVLGCGVDGSSIMLWFFRKRTSDKPFQSLVNLAESVAVSITTCPVLSIS